MRVREGLRQVNWWLPTDLIARLKEYQHAEKLDSLTEAARRLLVQGLDRAERAT